MGTLVRIAHTDSVASRSPFVPFGIVYLYFACTAMLVPSLPLSLLFYPRPRVFTLDILELLCYNALHVHLFPGPCHDYLLTVRAHFALPLRCDRSHPDG